MKRHGSAVDEGENGQENEKKSKHTLESDEEIDEDEKGGRMNDSELAVGQEPETIGHDGDIVITPFNMREELEEDGHFDASGTFIFKKTNEAGDNWLEDVDWSEVRRHEEQSGKVDDPARSAPAVNPVAEEEALPEATTEQQTDLYQRIASFLQPGETVLRALRRLGPTKSAAQRQRERNWIRRKDGTTVADAAKKVQTPEEVAKAEAFAKLTELANDLLGSGDFDIYQKTKEILEDVVTIRNRRNDDESELDALGAAIDNETGLELSSGDGELKSSEPPPAKWLVKRAKSAESDAEIEGPYEESVLREWLNARPSHVSEIFVKRQDAKDEEFRQLLTINFK
ncbi:unnamed protein product [Rodentolepis nana]|uniref:GYF domain-containing protein n=1 Tax=Rodentolepis nana TaxID=102285 RepID=A0A0R3TPB8_RODNA|nr:unnamed protein product [Rodentolepis nana]